MSASLCTTGPVRPARGRTTSAPTRSLAAAAEPGRSACPRRPGPLLPRASASAGGRAAPSLRRRTASRPTTTARSAAAATPAFPEEPSKNGASHESHDHDHGWLHNALEAGLGSVILLAATAVSLILANTALADTWMGLWDKAVGPAIGGHKLTVQGWVNEGLMAIFFFAVGLEIKRECVFGTLAHIRQSILPCAAALGGMVVPMAFYCAVNAGAGGILSGWAIPMATDIAFAMGVFGFFSKKMPRSASAFLLTLATVDDLGAILVIAIFFASKILVPYLAGAAAVTGGLFTIAKLPMKRPSLALYLGLGVALWYCLLVAGVNADVAGVVTALAIPATTPAPQGSTAEGLEPGDKPSLMDHLIHHLHPWTSLLIMPVFALANTAVPVDLSMLGGLLAQPVAAGIMLGLLVGKPLGITAFSLLAIKSGIASMPKGMTTKHIMVLGLLGGIGFTMCLFLIALALGGTPEAMRMAKLAVICASILAAIVGGAIMNTFQAPLPPFAGETLEEPLLGNRPSPIRHT